MGIWHIKAKQRVAQRRTIGPLTSESGRMAAAQVTCPLPGTQDTLLTEGRRVSQLSLEAVPTMQHMSAMKKKATRGSNAMSEAKRLRKINLRIEGEQIFFLRPSSSTSSPPFLSTNFPSEGSVLAYRSPEQDPVCRTRWIHPHGAESGWPHLFGLTAKSPGALLLPAVPSFLL